MLRESPGRARTLRIVLRITTLAAAAVAVIGGPGRGLGQTPSSWIGVEVLLQPEARLMVGNQVAASGETHRKYKVERANGNWLWITSNVASGWARQSDLIPWNGAEAYFTGIIQRNPRAAWAYNRRGLLRRDAKQWDAAIADYTTAIQLDPNNKWPYNNRANLWRQKEQYDRAIADYNQALELDPAFVMAYNNRGLVWSSKKDYDRAIADYNQALAYDPQYVLAVNNRGLAYLRKKDYARALADFDRSIQIAPKYSPAYSNRGSVYFEQGDFDRAIKEHTRAIQIAPENTATYCVRGWDYERKKDYARALADYETALRLDPEDGHPHAHLAWILATCAEAKVRDPKRAFSEASRAFVLSKPPSQGVLEVLAAAYAASGDYKAAVKYETQVLEKSASDPKEQQEARDRIALYQSKNPYHGETMFIH